MSTLTILTSDFRAHRVLHSVPTRRSSDLIAVTCTSTGPAAAPVGAVQMMLVGETVTTVATLPPKLTDTWPPVGGVKLDRKSTRLNSSHRCISYAVFCLKKKPGPSELQTGA